MSNENFMKKVLSIRGMGAAITAFAGLIIIYIAFGLINPAVFSGQNIMNLLRSMSKYLLIGIAQSYVLITGNIDLSIGTMVGMSAMVAATLMSRGVSPVIAILVALACCLACGVVNGFLVGKFKLGEEVFRCPVEELSERQKYQLVYTRIALQKPRVAFLIQPFMGADMPHRRFIWEMLEQLMDKGIGLVLLSVNPLDTWLVAQRTLKMSSQGVFEERQELEEHQMVYSFMKGDGPEQSK